MSPQKVRYASQKQVQKGIPWGTLALGAAMLILGFAGGYLARPLIGGTAAAPSADATSTAQQQAMERAVSQTRHFRGDANAPVTLLEFSDFQ